jgi:hypothetical protein
VEICKGKASEGSTKQEEEEEEEEYDDDDSDDKDIQGEAVEETG